MKKKLTLHRETIRNLTDTEVTQVRGGLPSNWTQAVNGTAACCTVNSIMYCVNDPGPGDTGDCDTSGTVTWEPANCQ